uniref:aspartate--tRNA ligase n=1 Tax=Timspurckia oligopyrenoides TaxID=708627 RepID=A0A7S0ZCG2_9RHOD|mmetsp:Transcript_12433/g.22463  ORF Transcript_12433/g.22463 Transcript_12433/m.22463 type:complete len:547 (+) Transcript_12433:60-1700(+)
MDGETVKANSELSAEEKQALRDEKKRLKEAEKAAKALKKAEEAAAAESAAAEYLKMTSGIEYLSLDDEPKQKYGSYKLVQSLVDGSGRSFTPLESLSALKANENLWIRARVSTIRSKGRSAFLVLRQMRATVQGLVSEDDSKGIDKNMIKWIGKEVTPESIIDIYGTIVEASVLSCSVKDVEIHVERLYLVSKADSPLPFVLEDAARPASDTSGAHVLRDTRLNYRVLDLRVPSHKAILRLQAAVSSLFRDHLSAEGFIEIHSPKLIGGASEGGANVFTLDYFGAPACLAQSPQLYKQMAICADFEKVYEVAPVFRAENANTHRHLTEFIGLDMEMMIDEHYYEVIRALDAMFVAIFDGLAQKFKKDLETIQAQYPFEPIKYKSARQNLILTFAEGVKMLRDAGYTLGDYEDLNTELERALGALVKEKYDTDFFFLSRFPSAVRPFYTMPAPDDSNYSNSFDVFIRGEEIVSGAQRIHDASMLEISAQNHGIDVETIRDYVNAFKYGAPPHGGAGVGLERVVMLYLAIGNVREACLFPRDPKRLAP